MARLKVDEQGKLDLGSVEGLSLDELRSWIHARLHGRDTLVSGDAKQGELPHFLIAHIYPDLDRFVRQDVVRVVEAFLWDMARNEGSSWRGEAAHGLLQLAQNLGERSFIEPVFEMAEEGRFCCPEAEQDDLHLRLLQSLTWLRWRGAPDFWQSQLDRAPDRYAGVVFAGLAHVALEHAFDLLPQLDWTSEDVRFRMRVALRGLLRAHDHAKLGQLLADRMHRLTPLAKEFLGNILPELQPFARKQEQWDVAAVKDTLMGLGFTPSQLSPRELALAVETNGAT